MAWRMADKEVLELEASSVSFGDEASEFLADLKASNPLFAALDGTPNASFVVFDLTSVGKPSNHDGGTKYQLATSGLGKALPSLITKPIHITEDFKAHRQAGKAWKPIGAFLGGIGIANADGSTTLRALGTLWSSDFPEEVARIKAGKAALGASYEITYALTATSKLAENVVEIGEYEFSGGAILMKANAAHQETQVLVADDTQPETAVLDGESMSTEERNKLKPGDFAMPSQRKFPMHDESHRKAAWSRVENSDLSDDEKAKVRDKVMAKAKAAGDDWAEPYRKLGDTWIKSKSASVTETTNSSSEGFAASGYTVSDPSMQQLIQWIDQHDLRRKGKNTNQRRSVMAGKLPGIPDEHEHTVEILIAAAVARETESLEAKCKCAETELATAKSQVEAVEAAKVELQSQVTALTTEKNKVEATLTTLQAEHVLAAERIAAIDKSEKLAAKLAELKAEFNLDEKLLAARMPLVEKLVAGAEPLTVKEWKELTAGGKATTASPASNGNGHVPLFASSGEGEMPRQVDREAVGRVWPGTASMKIR